MTTLPDHLSPPAPDLPPHLRQLFTKYTAPTPHPWWVRLLSHLHETPQQEALRLAAEAQAQLVGAGDESELCK